MKVKSNKPSFTPFSITIDVETEEDASILKRLFGLTSTIPRKVADHYPGMGLTGIKDLQDMFEEVYAELLNRTEDVQNAS